MRDSIPGAKPRPNEALKNDNRYSARLEKPKGPDLAAIKVYPAGTVLPANFQDQDWQGVSVTCSKDNKCEAYRIDLDGDGVDEVVLAHRWAWSVFAIGAEGKWAELGKLEPIDCALRDAFRKGQAARTAPRWQDVAGAGKRAVLTEKDEPKAAPECPG